MEVEDWIDAINQPEWQREKRNIFGPGDAPYVLEATYSFCKFAVVHVFEAMISSSFLECCGM